MIGLMQDRPLALPALVDRAAEMFGHKAVVTATVTGEVRAGWAEVVARARRLAGVLDRLDVPAGGVVGTFGWNSQRHLELYLAVPCSGRVLHTLNHRLFEEQLRFIVDDAADDVVFVDRSLLPTVWTVLADATRVRWVVVMDDGADADLPDDPRLLDYEELLADAAGAATTPWARIADEREAATLCYTSGTTGHPKGVLSSHRSVVLHALMLLGVDAFGIGERDVVMPIVPMFHVNAWGLPYAAMLAGSDLVLPGPAMSPSALLRQLVEHRVTFTAGVPAIWRGLLPLLDGADLSALRRVVSGGSALPLALSRAWEEAAGLPITSSWGMTETSPLVASSRIAGAHADLDAEARREVLAAPGPSVPLVRVRLVGEDGGRVAHDGRSPGEIQVSGPTVASAYLGGAGSFSEDGWLRTGDVGTIDGLGYLRIVDRTKDLVKSGGEWISSVELENAIMAHPDVAEAAVVGVPDDRWGERPVAFVTARADRALTVDDLRAHLAGRVASWWVPERFELVSEIPKTATGKFSKVALRARLGADT